MTIQPTKEMIDLVNARSTILHDLRRNTRGIIGATPEVAKNHLEEIILDHGYMLDHDPKELLADWVRAIEEAAKMRGIDV
jgi:hypothetical protein